MLLYLQLPLLLSCISSHHYAYHVQPGILSHVDSAVRVSQSPRRVDVRKSMSKQSLIAAVKSRVHSSSNLKNHFNITFKTTCYHDPFVCCCECFCYCNSEIWQGLISKLLTGAADVVDVPNWAIWAQLTSDWSKLQLGKYTFLIWNIKHSCLQLTYWIWYRVDKHHFQCQCFMSTCCFRSFIQFCKLSRKDGPPPQRNVLKQVSNKNMDWQFASSAIHKCAFLRF